jgi:hypothetical protein
MTIQHRRDIKVLIEKNSQHTDYRRDLQILTVYMPEMIFIDKRRMCEGAMEDQDQR